MAEAGIVFGIGINWKLDTMRGVFLAIVCLVSVVFSRAEIPYDKAIRTSYVDSLCRILPTLPLNSRKISVEIAIASNHLDADSTIKYSEILLNDAQKLGDAIAVMKANEYLSWASVQNAKYNEVIQYAYRSLAIADSLGDKGYQVQAYGRIALAYSMQNEFDNSLKYYKLAISLANEIQDTASLTVYYNNIAQTYQENNAFDDSFYYYEEAIKLDSLLGDTLNYYQDKLDWGYTICRKAIFDDNYNDFRKGKAVVLDCFAHMPEPSLSYTATNVVTMFVDEISSFDVVGESLDNLLDSCYNYFAILENCNEMVEDSKIDLKVGLARYYYYKGQYSKSQNVLDSLSTIVSLDDYTNIHANKICDEYISLYEALDNPRKLAYYYKKKVAYLENQDHGGVSKTVKAMAQVEYEKKLHDRELEAMRREGILESEARWRGVFIVLLLIVGALIVRGYILGRRANRKLNVQNDQLKEQKEEIETQNECLEAQKSTILAKNTQITDSINYASLIQHAALPSDQQMRVLFPDNFVIYKPLDIVSGDFYWATQVGNLKMLAVADCTGHGVPGAFVGMLGLSLLSDIAKTIDVRDVSAAVVLDQLRTSFKIALHQQGGVDDNRDGIDMVLIIINVDDLSMHYAGAFRPLVMFRDGNMQTLDADRMPIGIHYNEAKNFTDHQYQLAEGDMLYLFTDGFTDQFGYDEKREVHKFSRNRIKSLFSRINALPLEEQKKEIDLTFNKWREGSDGAVYEQTDDALMVGIRI